MVVWRWDEGALAWRAAQMLAGATVSLWPHAMLVPLRSNGCGLLARGAVTVNGLPALPFHVLADRDEIAVGGERMYFSTEGPAEVVPFADQAGQVLCGRCKGDMCQGEAAVRCPGCGAWHHETAKLPCWTYDGTCSACGRPSTGFSWQPEPLALPAREIAGNQSDSPLPTKGKGEGAQNTEGSGNSAPSPVPSPIQGEGG
jgi:hypothetical protein